MKTYFAKYLPVEGEIKEGDTISSRFGYTKVISIHIPAGTIGLEQVLFEDGYKHTLKYCKKVKLFLCSYYKDGEMLPKFEGPNGYTYEIQHNQQYDGKILKVIGVISPDAIWVKEGDEFDEEEIELRFRQHNSKLLFIKQFIPTPSLQEELNYIKVFKIKCPNCKTFH